MISQGLSESSEVIAARVQRVRNVQLERFKGLPIYLNSQMSSADIARYCKLDNAQSEYLKRVAEKYSLSARGYSRILKLARTIADMAGEENIKIEHISEAIQYRFQDFD
jgi:magnesium chelatase family protein